ncbi:nucleic-acid-binding protein from transposon X-element [Caerostris darwini]|uniref:Nucleic-acid-binding protein from transposon X-element n=1 Tax=Caerostris darwini TaxID=1538125 RepID=A0AAV4Q9W3_9ARAC|nr:nucleic-acid-binding protein from transposon X-element [Caerostris darwini]
MRIEINNLMNQLQKCKPDSPSYESTRTAAKELSEKLENRLIRVNLKVKQIPEHMDVLEEILSSFGINTADLEEPKPAPPTVVGPTHEEIMKGCYKDALRRAIQCRQCLDRHEKSLSQLDPSSENAALLKKAITFYKTQMKSDLKFILQDDTIYPNSSEELQAILNKHEGIPNSSTEVVLNQITPTSEEVTMDTSEESQKETTSTEEPYQIPPKRLTCRDQTQDPTVQGTEVKNQYSPLAKMDSENSTATPERKKKMPPFFITPNASWPETCKVLTSKVESLDIALSKGQFLKLSVKSEADYETLKHTLIQRNVLFKCYSLKKHTPLKVVIRGLPICTSKTDIAAALDQEKFKILNIAQLTSGRTKKPLPLFLVKIANSLLADEILKISSLHGIRVTVEKYRGRNIVPQCQRCYGFYHSSENCFLKVHCGVCAGDHPTKECKLQPDAQRTCINCQGSHAAFYRGCPNFPKRTPPQQKRFYPAPPQRPRTKISLEENRINRKSAPERSQRTYASTISNQNEQAHLSPSIPSKLKTNPTEVDLFSTLLKIIHLEEVNGPLLLIAYRAALPAIRKTNCLDEKYCIILEKYGAFLFN